MFKRILITTIILLVASATGSSQNFKWSTLAKSKHNLPKSGQSKNQRGRIESDMPTAVTNIYWDGTAFKDTSTYTEYSYFLDGRIKTSLEKDIVNDVTTILNFSYSTKGTDSIITVLSTLKEGSVQTNVMYDTSIYNGKRILIYNVSYQKDSNQIIVQVFGSKTNILYHNNGKIKELITLGYNNGEYEPETKFETFLKSNGEYDYANIYQPNDTTGTLEVFGKFTEFNFQDDDFDRPLMFTLSVKFGNTFVKAFRSTNTYTPDGLPLTSLNENANFLTGNFENSDRITFAYDVFGNETSSTSETWENAKWNVISKTTTFYQYDVKTRVTSATVSQYDVSTMITTNESKTFYTYGPLSIFSASKSTSSVSVYPNPATEFINVSSSIKGNTQLEIFNINGQLMLSENKNLSPGQQNSINIGTYSSGIYTIKITNGNSVGYAKFVK
ncbi:MAG: T9SS type A sorting domain-containing protein [Bacteroidota bacterium]|nr:T9SS type A sorting domain-containing protein [Bacteroidota bacterium]